MNPCSSREHIEDMDRPGFCLWCREPMPIGPALTSTALAAGARRELDLAAALPKRCRWDCPVPCPEHEPGELVHGNARIAPWPPRGTGRPVDVSLVCSACGAEFPDACAPDCPRPPDTIAVLLGAVAGGATLMLTGPDLLSGDRTIAATLESSSGASYASVEGIAIGPVLVELARRWLLERAPREQVGDNAKRDQQ